MDRGDDSTVVIPPRGAGDSGVPEGSAIEAEGLTQRFGDFVAVDNVTFRIPKGGTLGFQGSNSCGTTTRMKMLTGLLEPGEGQEKLFGEPADASDLAVRRRVGFMSRVFSLYAELTLRQNPELHAKLSRWILRPFRPGSKR